MSKPIMEEALDEVRRKGRLDIQERVFAKMKPHDPLADLVAGFSKALLEKLRAAETKYGYKNDWLRSDWEAECQRHLAEHLAKGDPIDVAAYAAFCWHHGWSTTDVAQPIAATPTDPSDIRKLDAVVHVLGIEDSEDDPSEVCKQLLDSVEELQRSHNAMLADSARWQRRAEEAEAALQSRNDAQATPDIQERIADLQYEAGMYQSLYENAAETIAKMAETFSDQGRDGHQIAKAVRASMVSSTQRETPAEAECSCEYPLIKCDSRGCNCTICGRPERGPRLSPFTSPHRETKPK